MEELVTALKINIKTKTNGNGLWSFDKKSLTHKKCSIHSYGEKFAEIRVFFNKKDWNIKKYGLIYTDPEWIKTFRKGLIEMGFDKNEARDCDYSEQGMQESNYVSLDAGAKFIKAVNLGLYKNGGVRRAFI